MEGGEEGGRAGKLFEFLHRVLVPHDESVSIIRAAAKTDPDAPGSQSSQIGVLVAVVMMNSCSERN